MARAYIRLLLDQTFFQLDPKQYNKLVEILDRQQSEPCSDDQALRNLLNTKAPWDEADQEER